MCHLDNDSQTPCGTAVIFCSVSSLLCDTAGDPAVEPKYTGGPWNTVFCRSSIAVFFTPGCDTAILCEWNGGDLGDRLLWRDDDRDASGSIAVVSGGRLSAGQRETVIFHRQNDSDNWTDVDDDIPGNTGSSGPVSSDP